MSIVNRGNQRIFVNFKQELVSQTFNQYLRNIFKSGIFSGADLTTDSTNIKISPFTAFFNSKVADTPVDALAVIIKTETMVVLDGSEFIDPSKTLLCMKYEWKNAFQNYIDFYVRDPFDSPETNEIILGEVEYSGLTVVGFDTTKRDMGYYDFDKDEYNLTSTNIFRVAEDDDWVAINIRDKGDWTDRENKHSGIMVSNGSENIGGLSVAYDNNIGRWDFHSIYNNGEKTDSDVIMSVRGDNKVIIKGSVFADNTSFSIFEGFDDTDLNSISNGIPYQRALTNIVEDNIEGCSVNNNIISILKGTYMFDIECLNGSYDVSHGNSIRIYDVTNSSLLEEKRFSVYNQMNFFRAEIIVEIIDDKDIEIQTLGSALIFDNTDFPITTKVKIQRLK